MAGVPRWAAGASSFRVVDRPVAISTQGLTKRYGPILALDRLDLEVPTGSITGLLGPSGSGRTTVLRLLAGLARPTSGSAVVAGLRLDDGHGVQVRRRIGVLPASDGIYEWMSGREQVSFAAELAGIPRTEIPDRVTGVLERVGLGVLADARTPIYDLAQRRRLGLAQALIGDPEILLLDDPVSSLDPATRTELLGIVGALRDRATVLLSTAEPAHVEAVCDRVAVLEGGRLVVAARVDALLGGISGTTYLITVERTAGLAFAGLVARLGGEPWVRSVEADGLVLRVSVRDDVRAGRELLPEIVATGLPIASFRRERPTLADAVRELSGREAAGREPATTEPVA
jgi:ABC-2 type transport system ATP-binding protein